MQIQISCDDTNQVNLQQNIAEIFNDEIMFVVGDVKIGRSASYQGFMSNILVHKPASDEYPWSCTGENKVYTKRGASFRTNEDGKIDRLNRIVQELQRNIVAFERRLAVRETCDCVSEDDSVCFDNEGNIHQNGESWDVNPCLRCSCIDRTVNCANHSTSCYQLSPCRSSPCLNNGYCEEDADLREGFKCSCPHGYFGDLCESMNPCSVGEVCQNGGVCTFIRSHEYRCDCRGGFTGKQCTVPLACSSNPCDNGGVCENTAEGEFRCDCPKGYSGLKCSDQNFCQPNPCLHEGMCYELRDGFRCRCRGIFRGDICEVEDWCFSEPCQNGGQCRQTDYGFTCSCPAGYSGLVCEDTDFCQPSSCQNGGECLEHQGSYKCECPVGYTGNDCEIMDQCGFSPCSNGGECQEYRGSYICECPFGFTGTNCEDSDLCTSSTCLNGGRCIPSENARGYSCICPPSHVGKNCEYLNHCSVNPCLNGGACDTLPNGEARCRCRLTHYGDRCENMDYCRGNPCKNGAVCRNNVGNIAKPFSCDCKATFVGDLCEFKDLCQENPCYNSGRCEMIGAVRSCICSPLYYGNDCEMMDYCRERPCKNGGRCINEERGYLCACQNDFLGNRCENRHPCRPNPCRNNGVCTIVDELQIRCECPPSHYGQFCTQEDRCRNNPCLNGGTCINTADGFECKCLMGFRGKTCALTELCQTNPCRNGGTCVEEDGTFRCICPESHQGTYCEYNCNVCMSPSNVGNCAFGSGIQSSVRWYFNKNDQSCEQFQYSGCGGNGNNFITRQDCRRRCIVGSCCSVDITTEQRSCRFTSINQCKKTNLRSSNIQVLSFEAGKRCSRHSCKVDDTCKVGLDEYREDARTNVGCGKVCSCNDAALLCTCQETAKRREIQHLTTEERNAFIKAVTTLKFSEEYNGRNSWDTLRDEYIQYAAIAQDADYFLLWNRAFLWKMEFLLKKIDCSVTIPFYDFTLDAGSFENAVIWQPNFFGGNSASDGCVKHHMFKEFNQEPAEWKPCIFRSFNLSVGIPNMIDISKAMNSRSYKEISTELQQIVANVHAFIGGDMFQTSRAYDPLFYVIHAYIDHVFMMWQKLNPDNEDLQHIPGIDLIQFGTTPDELWRGACVEYLPHTYHLPCNRSAPTPELFGSEGYNLQGFNRQGFNRDGFDKDGFNVLGRDVHGQLDTRNLFDQDGYNAHGYNRSGYDQNGYDRFGFDTNGINRDGYNTKGFNRQGYNRYGLDQHGFDKRGYNIYGTGRDYKPDSSTFYDEETGFNDCCFGRDGLSSLGQDRFGYSIEGFDDNTCNYFFNGPHTLYYQQKLWPMVHVQTVPFLSTIPRNCRPITQLSDRYYTLNWIQDVPEMSYTIYSPMKSSDSNEAFTHRLCFDVNLLLTWCPCLEENYPAICANNPCENAQCPLHRNARCTINMCGNTCKAEFVQDGRIVNCDNPCSMNPCQNGGTCVPSRFLSDAESYQCLCPAEYTGTLCEEPVSDMCMLDKAGGNCGGRFRRWFYNRMTMKCEEFVFTGCNGNPNNFASKKACDLSCSTGACCYRFPINQTFEIGFDRDGYDKYGFNPKGLNRLGQQSSEYDSMPTGNRINPPKGFGPDGFDIFGYNEKGVDRQGYDRSGYNDDTGYNRTGHNADGEYDELRGFDREGFDANGFDRAGFSCSGIDREGFNQLGLYYDFSYTCQTLYLHECEALRDPIQLGVPFEVISFSPGKSCGEVECGESCGCDYKGKKYHFGETFHSGCNKCTCSLGGVVNCQCHRIGKRTEIRDMNQEDFHKYVKAIQQLHTSKKWEGYAQMHAQHMPQANGADISLPWHRYFLRMIEDDIRDIAGCSISIPYYDWTIDAGDLENSQIWQANYFGGNGCVKYQPFASEDTWHPCIRRMFNTSINLPDAVTIQFIIRESSYEKFRLQLETVSGLFHLWVGGHMASPFSPYDPVYLSHWAFMDLIWSEWQLRNPEGVSRFPPMSRYVKMKPFDVTADDVLSTQQQICVVYTPPTLGTSCNKTNGLLLARGTDGFDRHGFDAEGYDIDGFNVQGYDRRGRPDHRQLYDEEGYNKYGYDRSGYDKLGWDIFGFNRQNYNRDGIDLDGYDKYGFNRYGFDRSGKTPFGMYTDGRYAPGVDRGYAASLFDKFGYNRLGFDKFGLDHQGFDVFGFDKTGFDQDDCNYFNHGPQYMRKFYVTVTQLRELHPESLKLIARICEPISPLPEYWLSQTWLAKLPVIREIEETWKVNHEFDASWTPQSSSVTKDKLWHPISPEAQFCFKLEDFGTCPIGTPLVECPTNLCQQTTCASQPSAQCRMKNCGACYPEFYDGTTGEVYECYGCIDSRNMVHTEGSMWEEDCKSCLCQAGMINCQPKMCEKVMCSHPAKSSGACCESCQDCEFEGRVYGDGQAFRPNRCQTCSCRKGNVLCENTVSRCPAVTCKNPLTIPGECCPSCPTDCMGHRENDVWDMGDCDTCLCRNSMVKCIPKPCPVVQCSHPIKMAGECCEECTGCVFEDRKYVHGQNFMQDECTQCTCSFGNVQCVTQNCPRLTCDNQETPKGSCCPRCRSGMTSNDTDAGNLNEEENLLGLPLTSHTSNLHEKNKAADDFLKSLDDMFGFDEKTTEDSLLPFEETVIDFDDLFDDYMYLNDETAIPETENSIFSGNDQSKFDTTALSYWNEFNYRPTDPPGIPTSNSPTNSQYGDLYEEQLNYDDAFQFDSIDIGNDAVVIPDMKYVYSDDFDNTNNVYLNDMSEYPIESNSIEYEFGDY